MNKQQAMSHLRRSFPEFDDHSAEAAHFCGHSIPHSIDVYDYALFVADLQEHGHLSRVRSAFDLVEEFFADGSSELRDWVCAWIEAVQNVAAWRPYGPTVFTPFLGRKTRAIWDGVETVWRTSFELDLAGCTVFEAEVLTWRFVREKVRTLSAAA